MPEADEILDAFFAELPPIAGVSVERYTLTSPADERKPANYPCAVCFTDGAASTAVKLRKTEGGSHVSPEPVILAASPRARAGSADEVIGAAGSPSYEFQT